MKQSKTKVDKESILKATENWLGKTSDKFLDELELIFDTKKKASSQLLSEVGDTVSNIKSGEVASRTPIFIGNKLNLTFAEFTIHRMDDKIAELAGHKKVPKGLLTKSLAVDTSSIVDLIIVKLAFILLWNEAKQSGNYITKLGKL